MSKATPELIVVFKFDNVRGVYEGQIKGTSARFMFGGAIDAPIPRALHNALTGLRRETMLTATGRTVCMDTDVDLEDLQDKIRKFEAKGGRVQTVQPRSKQQVTKLSLDDLEL